MSKKKSSVLDAKERIAQLCREKKEQKETREIAHESRLNKERERLKKVGEKLKIITNCISYTFVDVVCTQWINNLMVYDQIKTDENTVIAITDLIYTIASAPVNFVVELGPSCNSNYGMQECRYVRLFGTSLSPLPVTSCFDIMAQCIICKLCDPTHKLFDHYVVSSNVAARYTLSQFKYDEQIDAVLDRKNIIEHIIFKILNLSMNRPKVTIGQMLSSTPLLFGAMTIIEIILDKCLQKFYTSFQASQLQYKIDESKLEAPRQRARIIYETLQSFRKFARLNMDMEVSDVISVVDIYANASEFFHLNFCNQTNSKMDPINSF